MSHDHNTADASHGNIKQYSIGFILSVILTIIPFGMVMSGMTGGAVVATIAITAVAQVLVQLVFFLHMNSSSEQRWNVIALAFTALLVFIFVGGTVWVMYTLNLRMM